MIPAGTKVYFAVAPTDLRKSFDGLSALAMGELQKNPSEGGLFVFLNKRGDQIRVLFRDRHGCCVLAKRLDRGRFRRPRVKDGSICWEVEAPALMAFLDDIETTRARARRSPESIARHLKIVKAPSSSS
jgi:transposase